MEADWCAQAKFGAEGGALAKCLIQRQRVTQSDVKYGEPGAAPFGQIALAFAAQRQLGEHLKLSGRARTCTSAASGAGRQNAAVAVVGRTVKPV